MLYSKRPRFICSNRFTFPSPQQNLLATHYSILTTYYLPTYYSSKYYLFYSYKLKIFVTFLFSHIQRTKHPNIQTSKAPKNQRDTLLCLALHHLTSHLTLPYLTLIIYRHILHLTSYILHLTVSPIRFPYPSRNPTAAKTKKTQDPRPRPGPQPPPFPLPSHPQRKYSFQISFPIHLHKFDFDFFGFAYSLVSGFSFIITYLLSIIIFSFFA